MSSGAGEGDGAWEGELRRAGAPSTHMLLDFAPKLAGGGARADDACARAARARQTPLFVGNKFDTGRISGVAAFAPPLARVVAAASMAPKVLGAKRGTNVSPGPTRGGASPSAPPPSGPSPIAASPSKSSERTQVYVRIRPTISEEEDADNSALQCDRASKLVWAMAGGDDGGDDAAPRQYAFDDILEQRVGQAELFDCVGAAPTHAAIGGNVGCVLSYGASGAGKDYSVRCERPGQEGLLLRSLALIFSGNATLVASTPRPQRAYSEAEPPAARTVSVAYLSLSRDQTVLDLLGGNALDLANARGDGPMAIAETARWEHATNAGEVSRILSKADASRHAKTAGTTRDGCHALILLRLGDGLLIFASLASIDSIAPSAGGFTSDDPLSGSVESLGRCLECLANPKRGAAPTDASTLTRLLAPALGVAAKEASTSLLLCVHPSKAKLSLTAHALAFGQLSISANTRTKASASVDYHALAAQLMSQRDGTTEALQELECKVLRNLRPQLEEVRRATSSRHQTKS